MAVINVLSSLIKEPLLLMDEHYPLSLDDFPERFHKIIFGAIEHLIKSGVKQINEVVIDDYLSGYPKQYAVFSDNQGMDYIIQALELTTVSNYEYYYDTLRKCSLLNNLEENGFDIKEFYDPLAIRLSDQQQVQQKMDTYSVSDILDKYKISLTDLEMHYCSNSDIIECHIADGMEELKTELAEEPAFGLPMNSAKLNTICHGRRLKKFYLKTLPSGQGKTRISMGDACRVAVPQYYDIEQKKWIKTKCHASTLFITTELEIKEIQTLLWAYVACVDEDHIVSSKYEGDESARVDKAIQIIKNTKFYSVYISNFDVADIENIIKRYKMKYGCDYVFFDYIYSSSKTFAEVSAKARGFKLREDQSLMMFSERIKALCNKLNIHVDSSTQANDDWKNQKNPDQSVIRGAKAIADKVDIGFIGLEPSEKDLLAARSIMGQLGMAFCKEPNMVYHIYKVRRGRINHVKLFLYFDFGTLRTTDLFVTDRNYHLIDVENTQIEIILEQTDETLQAENLKSVDFSEVKW